MFLLIMTTLWFPYNTFVAGISGYKTEYLKELGKIIKKSAGKDDYFYVFSTLNYRYGMIIQAYYQRKSPTKYFAHFSLDLKGAVKQISQDIVKDDILQL